MQAANRNHQHLGINSMHLGVSAGPLSLLLLPKCPLCLVPLLAVLGLAIPPTTGLWIASGLLVAVWLAILLAVTRRQPVIRAVAFVAAAASFVAIGFHIRLLLWIGVLAMAAAGFALSRICVHRAVRSQTLTHPSAEA